VLRIIPTVFGLMGCPDPPDEISTLQEPERKAGSQDGAVRPGSDPSRMDLSPGGTVLLDMAQVKVQLSQAEVVSSGVQTVSLTGELFGDCTGGTLRIDVIELGLEPEPTGPMLGPITALYPSAAGPFTVVVPKGKNIQIAAICDIDKDDQIVQDTDKLAPGVALGVLEEDKADLVLAFPGEQQATVPSKGDNTPPGAAPPGDQSASKPSATLSDPLSDTGS
jgi:hypothetical protein